MRTATALFAFALGSHLTAAAAPSGAVQLARWLVGSFANSAQATASKEYRHAALNVAAIWTDRADGPWLYLEQALIDLPESPYRQQVLQLVDRADGGVECRFFAFADPVRHTGAWRDPARLASLAPELLKPRTGCTIILQWRPDGAFAGRTEGKGCASELPGADHSISELRISELETTLWERGFNSAGAQVWGPISGGYVFRKSG